MFITLANIVLRISELCVVFVIIGNRQLDSNLHGNRVVTTHFHETWFPNTSHEIQKWVHENTHDMNISQHWWYENLPEPIFSHFCKISRSATIKKMFATLFHSNEYKIDGLPGMNELYVAGIEQDKITSDHVFYTKHIDGPFVLLPFVSIYRCIVGLNENEDIVTHFTGQNIQIQSGDVMGFDFNREVHYISKKNTTKKLRITAKVHYCVYPKNMEWFGKRICVMNVNYDRLFRNLFMSTIHPSNYLETLGALIVMTGTKVYVWFDIILGYENALHIGFYLMLKKYFV